MFPYKNQYPSTLKDECCNSGNTGDGVSEAQVVSLINNAIAQDVTPDLLALLAKNEEQDTRIDRLSLNKTAVSPADITIHLDELRSSGFYRRTDSPPVTTEQGFPETETYRKGGFVLALFNNAGTFGIQQYYNFAGKHWQRAYYNKDGWSEWKRVDADSSGTPADEYYYIPIYDTEALILKGAEYIDTGLKLNGNTHMMVVGSLPDTTKQAVLVGAYKSNSERTVLKILGQAHKIQSQWASNKETTAEQVAEMDFSKRFIYYQSPESILFLCSSKSVRFENTGFVGVDEETPLLLFNQTKTGEYNNGALHEVLIRNIRDGVTDSYGVRFRGARKYKKSDGSFVGYTFVQIWKAEMFVRELPLPDGAYFELYEMQQ